MVTPIEVQNKVFKSSGLGYDKKDVEQFMHEVLQSFDAAYRENMEMKDRIAMLNEGINYYKTIERTLQRALVLAEKTAEETKATAIREAQQIENEAKAKARMTIAEANQELESLQRKMIELSQEYEKFKLQIKNAARIQVELLDSDVFQIGDVQELMRRFQAENAEQPTVNGVFSQDQALTIEIATDQVAEAPNYKRLTDEYNVSTASGNTGGRQGKKNDVPDGQEEFSYIDLNDEEA